MKNRKLKTLAAALALTMTVGAVPPVTGTEIPMITTTVEAAAKKVSLKAYNKKVYAGRSGKIKVKSTRGAKLSYKTSNKKIATVNSRGVVTGKKAGTVKITITAKKSKYKTVKKTITVKVVKQNQKITAVSQTLALGQRKNLGAKARTPMTYKSSNPKVVTVDKKGNLKALRPGTAKIKVYAKATGTFNKASRTITVKVVKKATAPKQTETVKPTAVPKQTETKAPETQPPQTETKASDTEPKQTEPAKPEEPKQTETTKPEEPKQTEPDLPKETETEKPAEPPKETETPKETEPPIIVPTEKPAPDVAYVTDISIEKTADDTLYIGEPKDCNVKWVSTGKTTRNDFTYDSSDDSVATVDKNGTITPLKAGKVTITVTSKTPFAAGGACLSASKRYTVKVQYNDEYADGVGFKAPEDVATKGRNVGIGETINPNAGISKYDPEKAEKYLTFSSSDPSVATIDKYGNITGVSKGYVTFTVKTKLPVEPTGTYYKENSATYHVGDYTYEEILNGLTADLEASKTAHNVLNELRQDKTKRPVDSQSFPVAEARDWCDACYQESVVRGSRNIICTMLNSWNTGEKSTVNPLATHGGNQNGYGGDGWETTGAELGEAATEFFYDGGHAANQTNVNDKYSATAVVQYKNTAGVNLTSMIVTMSPYSYEKEKENALLNSVSWIADSIKGLYVPEDQYYDICKHFNLSYGMENTTDVQADMFASESVATEDIFTDGSAGAVNITDFAETADAGQQEETEETKEIELSPEEETDAVSDVDVTFE